VNILEHSLQQEKSPDFSVFPANMHMTSGQLSFSCRLNPDWSIQILVGAPTVCKANVIYSEKRTVFRERTVSFEGQIMFRDKHPSIYCKPVGNYFVYYPSNVFHNTRHIQPRDAFKPIACERTYLMDYNRWQYKAAQPITLQHLN